MFVSFSSTLNIYFLECTFTQRLYKIMILWEINSKMWESVPFMEYILHVCNVTLVSFVMSGAHKHHEAVPRSFQHCTISVEQ